MRIFPYTKVLPSLLFSQSLLYQFMEWSKFILTWTQTHTHTWIHKHPIFKAILAFSRWIITFLSKFLFSALKSLIRESAFQFTNKFVTQRLNQSFRITGGSEWWKVVEDPRWKGQTRPLVKVTLEAVLPSMQSNEERKTKRARESTVKHIFPLQTLKTAHTELLHTPVYFKRPNSSFS